MTNLKTILITGAHHTPAIELIRQLKLDPKTNWNIHYVGHLSKSDTHISRTLIPKLKDNFHPLESGKFDRRWLPNTLEGIPKIFSALVKSINLVKKINPDIIVSFGGYISVPVIIAGFFLKRPSITHEQTSTLSLSTRINSLFASKVALSFNTGTSPKTVITGNLLRFEIFNPLSKTYKNLEPKLKKNPLIYITGGNQGSAFFNQLSTSIVPILSKKFTIIHQTGNHSSTLPPAKNYHPTPYIDTADIGWVLNHALVVISRSGANICQEVVALKKSSLLIPLPFSQQDEQLQNANWVKSNLPNNTIILPQSKADSTSVIQSVETLSQSGVSKTTAKPLPNTKLLDLIYEVI